MESKPVYLSKTVWINLVMAVSVFVPIVNSYLVAHPESFVVVFTVVNVILRLVSHGKLELS